MTVKEVDGLIRHLQEVFDIVRLVDVAMTTQYKVGPAGTLVPEAYPCYTVWNRQERCENCISAKAFAQKARLSKYEFIGEEIYYVVSKYIEVDGTPYMLEIVANVADQVMFSAFGKQQLIQTIRRHNERMYKDSLTGAYNRQYYEEQLQSLQQSSALALADVDDFKRVNDTFGHQAGDRALQEVVRVFQENMRNMDAVIRYGGDEFLLVFRNIPGNVFAAKLERLRAQVEQIEIPEYPGLRITVSIGGNSAGGTGVDRIRCADRCLYAAKKRKNSICCG